MIFGMISGVESIYFPLPLRTNATQEPIPLRNVAGARGCDPKPVWLQKRQTYETEHFPAERDLTARQAPLAGRFRRLQTTS